MSDLRADSNNLDVWVPLPTGYDGPFKDLNAYVKGKDFEAIDSKTKLAKVQEMLRSYVQMARKWFTGEVKRRPEVGDKFKNVNDILGGVSVDEPISGSAGTAKDDGASSSSLEKLRKDLVQAMLHHVKKLLAEEYRQEIAIDMVNQVEGDQEELRQLKWTWLKNRLEEDREGKDSLEESLMLMLTEERRDGWHVKMWVSNVQAWRIRLVKEDFPDKDSFWTRMAERQMTAPEISDFAQAHVGRKLSEMYGYVKTLKSHALRKFAKRQIADKLKKLRSCNCLNNGRKETSGQAEGRLGNNGGRKGAGNNGGNNGGGRKGGDNGKDAKGKPSSKSPTGGHYLDCHQCQKTTWDRKAKKCTNKDCKRKRNQQKAESASEVTPAATRPKALLCYKCNNKGHISRDCPQKNRKNASTSFFATEEEDDGERHGHYTIQSEPFVFQEAEDEICEALSGNREGILKASVRVKTKDGQENGTVALDTGSTINLINQELAKKFNDADDVPQSQLPVYVQGWTRKIVKYGTVNVKSLGGLTKFDRIVQIQIAHGLTVYGFPVEETKLPFGCDLLLGLPALRRLKIDLNGVLAEKPGKGERYPMLRYSNGTVPAVKILADVCPSSPLLGSVVPREAREPGSAVPKEAREPSEVNSVVPKEAQECSESAVPKEAREAEISTSSAVPKEARELSTSLLKKRETVDNGSAAPKEVREQIEERRQGFTPDGLIPGETTDDEESEGLPYRSLAMDGMGERYAASEVEHCVSRDLTQNAEWFNSANLQDDDVDDEPETSYLQEHVMRDFLERNPDAKVKPRKTGINNITWNDIPEMDLPGFSLRKLLSDPTAGWTFATSTGLPPPCRAAPHEIELVPGAKPFRMPRPKYKPAREAYLNMWDKEMFRQGAHEPSTSAGATSTVEVPKPPNVKDVRVCINLAMPNQRFVKRVPQTRDLRSETRKLSGMTMFFSTDGHNAFGQVILAKHSRKHCAYWTPSGLRQPTRMVFGDTNAPTKWQGFVDESCAGLSEKAKKHLANYVDDFLIGVTGSTLREAAKNLYVCVKEFLEMCKENGITLSPHKTFIGFATAKFGGRTVGQGKTCVTEDALKPIREMQHPTDKASLRRTLGMFVQSKDFIPSYSMLAKPLTRLTGKVPWQWTDTEQEAFGNMRSAVLKYTKLHTPDYSRPIYIRVDASDEGEGGYLFQLEKPYDDEELKDIDPKHVQVIKYFSKAYGPTMRKMPIYYREAHAAIFGMKKCEDILMRAHIPTVVISDHAPFQWVLRTVTRTVVTRWIVENICALQWRVVYVAGEKNVVPDALSRFPVIARGHFLTTGLESAVDHLLSAVDARWKEAKTIWVWARKDTTSMARKVQAWRNPKNAVLTGAPKRILEESEPFDVAVVVPEAERAPEYCKKLFLKKKPFACLIPSDLVFWIPRDSKDREVLYQDVVDALEKASKITYLDAGLTWIVSGTEFPDEVMFEQTDDSLGEKFDDKLIARTGGEVGTDPLVLQAWVKAQKAEIDDIKKYYGEQVAKLSSGLKIVVDRQSGLSRIYVPRCFREQVAQKVHESTSHGGWKRVELALKKKYIWPSMQSYLKSYVRSCVHCVLAKSKLNWAHGRFKAVEYKLPCRAYALDFYSIGETEDGHIGVLTMVDLC